VNDSSSKQADLAEPDSAEEAFSHGATSTATKVDTLINNAGFAAYGTPTEIDLHKLQRMLMLNVGHLYQAVDGPLVSA